MNREPLQKLLHVLGASEEEAAAEYLKLHLRLSRFFALQGASDPEGLADETLDRLSKRIDEGDGKEPIRNLPAFTVGIARLVEQENYKRQQRQSSAAVAWQAADRTAPAEKEAMDAALQHCLSRLQPERRALIERYYTFGDQKKAEAHQSLSKQMGITVHALRNRALRARQDLEECMRGFLGRR